MVSDSLLSSPTSTYLPSSDIVWYDIAAQLQIGRVFKESLQLTKHHPTDLTSFETFPRSEMRAFKHLYVQHNRKWYAALDNAVGDTEEDRIRAARKAL